MPDPVALVPLDRLGTMLPTGVMTPLGEIMAAIVRGAPVAFSPRCPHKDESLRHAVLMEDRIICPHHHYEFMLPDGTCRNARRCGDLVIETLEVRDGHCYISMDALNRVVRGH